MRLGVLASHPIQYHAPWFRALAQEINVHVFFAHRPDAKEQAVGFGGAFQWDVDLFSGYQHTFLSNIAQRPGVNHFFGCDTPEIAAIIAGEIANRSSKLDGEDWSQSPGSDLLPTAERPFDAFIITGWNLKSYWQAVNACRANKIPVLVRTDSQLRKSRSILTLLIKRVIYPELLKRFDGFLYVGKRSREYLEHYRVPKRKLFLVPHFVDNDRFAAQANQIRDLKVEIRKQWGIAPDAFVPLFVGKFIPKKRPLDLVKAAQLLVSKSSELQTPSSIATKLQLLFVGSGELGTELRANCNVIFDAELGQKSDTDDQRSVKSDLTFDVRRLTSETMPPASFAGFLNQSEISNAYLAADVLILPSESETWGLVVNEAMTCGLPSIVSNAVGCAPDLIEEGKTGFVFEPRNPKDLALRLVSLWELLRQHHEFQPAIERKLRTNNLDVATRRTIEAVRAVGQ
jgi:glycosyltransferase involved in cell wall biosynthesis